MPRKYPVYLQQICRLQPSVALSSYLSQVCELPRPRPLCGQGGGGAAVSCSQPVDPSEVTDGGRAGGGHSNRGHWPVGVRGRALIRGLDSKLETLHHCQPGTERSSLMPASDCQYGCKSKLFSFLKSITYHPTSKSRNN